MNHQRFVSLVAQSLRRNRRHFLLASIGVIVGIATLFFFTSLGEGVRATVLEDIFVIDRLEVVDPAAGAGLQGGGLFGASGLDDATVERVDNVDGVRAVYPKMKLTFPSYASGGEGIVGQDMGIEFIADGIPDRVVADDVDDDLEFRDHSADQECADDSACSDGQYCSDDNQCQWRRCDPDESVAESSCQGTAYCHSDRQQCALPIPIVISPYLLEVYNGSVHTALADSQGAGGNLPRLTESMLIGFEFDLILGTSFLGRSGEAQRQTERARIVGFSEQAMQLGATMPLDYVVQFNEQFTGQEAAEYYHSILVETDSNEDVAAVAQYLEDEMGLELSDRHSQARRAGILILSLTLLFNLIALIILAVSAITITHTFSMMVMERRTEIGLMRAVGATRRQIQALVVGEATIVGLVAGFAGIALGATGGLVVDALFARYVPDFPFKPETLFAWSPWMFALAMATAIIFCLIGAYLPARRAGNVDPADALTGR